MKLFIFKPSKHWRFMGGGRAVIAQDFHSAINMFDDKAEYSKEEFSEPGDGWDKWVLVGEFEVNENRPRVVLDSYNWA